MEWTITYDDQVAVIDACGGGLRSYRVGDVPVVDGYPQGERAPGGAGQVLAPWPNRIRDGRYRYNGRSYELVLTEPENDNAIHGLVRRLTWELCGRSANSVTVHRRIADEPGYPFDVALTTRWTLSEDGLGVEHTAEKLSPGPAPFGLGIHPYLMLPGISVDDVELFLPADHVLPADARGLPTELQKVAGTDLDFRTPRRIDATVLDHAFTDVGEPRCVRLSRGDDGVELRLGSAFPWVQVFTGDTLPGTRRRRSVAVEPMTCPADAFNSRTDLVTLDLDAPWSGSWSIRRIR